MMCRGAELGPESQALVRWESGQHVAQFDSLSPGVVTIRSRAIGFLPLRHTWKLRAGYRDTLEMQMRTDRNCLSSSGAT